MTEDLEQYFAKGESIPAVCHAVELTTSGQKEE